MGSIDGLNEAIEPRPLWYRSLSHAQRQRVKGLEGRLRALLRDATNLYDSGVKRSQGPRQRTVICPLCNDRKFESMEIPPDPGERITTYLDIVCSLCNGDGRVPLYLAKRL